MIDMRDARGVLLRVGQTVVMASSYSTMVGSLTELLPSATGDRVKVMVDDSDGMWLITRPAKLTVVVLPIVR